MSNIKTIGLEEGWNIIQEAIKKVENIIEGLPEPNFTSQDHVMLYTIVHNMCTSAHSDYYSQKLYDKYKETFEVYIKSTVLPSLREKKDELLLRELIRRWSNHKDMTGTLSKFFIYLDRYHIRRHHLPSLEETSCLSFYYLVYNELNRQVMDAILAMINRKHAGELIDETLVNSALNFYYEIGESTKKYDPKHFAETMIKENETFNFMSRMSRLQIG